jgi:hypothetical protein
LFLKREIKKLTKKIDRGMHFPQIYTIGLCSFGKISSKGLIIGNTKKKIANANITAETINNIFLFINSLMSD